MSAKERHDIGKLVAGIGLPAWYVFSGVVLVGSATVIRALKFTGIIDQSINEESAVFLSICLLVLGQIVIALYAIHLLRAKESE